MELCEKWLKFTGKQGRVPGTFSGDSMAWQHEHGCYGWACLHNHNRNARFGYRCCTTGIDGAEVIWAGLSIWEETGMEKGRVKAVEKKGWKMGEGEARIKGGYTLLTRSQNQGNNPTRCSDWSTCVKPATVVGRLKGTDASPHAGWHGTQGSEGCSTLALPCPCLQQPWWLW